MKQMIATIGLASTLLLSGCGGVDSGNNASPNNFFNKTATLQGTVFDGVTGAKITDSSLKVTMVQGSSYRAANTRTGTQDNAGDYSISGVPISLNDQTTYRMIVNADLYQDFETAISFSANYDSQDNNNTLDNVYNFVGNVNLYPVGAYASDVTVLVTYNGEPVADAKVLLKKGSVTSDVSVDGSGSYLFNSSANSGYPDNLMADTDATGVATFSGGSLMLGGRYNIDVLPVTHEGTVLARNINTEPINIGAANVGSFPLTQGNNSRVVVMEDQVPGFGNQNGLYIVDASNSNYGTVAELGILTIKFSKPVELSETNPIVVGVILLNAGAAVLDPTTPVTAEMSTDGLTLTLTPKFTTKPAPGDFGATVEYDNVRVRLTGAGNAITYDVLDQLTASLRNTGGARISNRVQMQPWN